MSADSLRVVFMGTPAFAVPTLEALHGSQNEIIAVYTQPDRRSGRGRRVTASPIKEFAEEHSLPVFQPSSLRRDADARAQLTELKPDAILVAAYGLFLPKETLDLPRLGCLNIHPSLLPKHRGPSPVATAILEGDETTGVSIMLLDEGMDTGPILAQQEVEIANDETTADLTERLFETGSKLLVETLDSWHAGQIEPVPQNDDDATVTRLLERDDGRLDWNEPAESLARRVRAFTPWPGTFSIWNGKTLKIIQARAVDAVGAGLPGTVLRLDDASPAVVTGDGVLEILSLQLEGRKAAIATDFIQGYRDFVGSTLGA